jgi:hypothetical protein
MKETLRKLQAILGQKKVVVKKPTENGNRGFHAEC